MTTWTEQLTHNGKVYTVTFIKRPFREGLEVQLEIDQQLYTFADLALGHDAIISRLREEIDILVKREHD